MRINNKGNIARSKENPLLLAPHSPSCEVLRGFLPCCRALPYVPVIAPKNPLISLESAVKKDWRG